MASDTASTDGATVAPLPLPAGTAMDPAVALSLNVHASPGVYALLLGSGVSLASGVKTGWGIVQDLVGKVAAAHDPHAPDAAQSAAEDPEGWWREKFGEALSYSGLLAAVAPTSAARQAQLAGYFDPDKDDEEGNGKLPTAAHRAIAQLVKRGSIRVILTTNFDRLMEHALQEVGISPQVVHRPDQATAIKPLAHSTVTIIKLHGDYADLDQRNTVDELGTYPEAQQRLLASPFRLGAMRRRCGVTVEWPTRFRCSDMVETRRGGRVLQGPSGRGRSGFSGQPAGRGSAARRWKAVASSFLQGQVADIRKRRRRPPWVRRAATCSSR